MFLSKMCNVCGEMCFCQKMGNVCGEMCFYQKMFTNGLSIDLPQRVWVEKME